ncbi:transposase [Halomonas heilongjiangensis]|uniref:Transposase n=1 Tax=Halomonas heilongjiangensis TaxID=1387883 RepID=A0A2N7TJE9_9GAMM|nr:transposase [Halomonas heilongjiangensis]PMR68317.1 transposase [Halomonas heilongjiangensis]PXX89051.1 transposase [Halomonas heilongjiangensis]
MARPARLLLPDTPLHLIQRGNNRGACFVHRKDALRYLELLGELRQVYRVALHAYVLMTNHVHLLATPQEDPQGVILMMKELGQRYAQYFNRRHQRTGGLFEGRYRSCLVAEEPYLFACYRYIELNPVRAGMVPGAADYEWSSHRANALGRDDPIVQPHDIYTGLGTTPETRRGRYRELFHGDLPPHLLDEIRQQTRRGRVLGSEAFQQAVARRLDSSP